MERGATVNIWPIDDLPEQRCRGVLLGALALLKYVFCQDWPVASRLRELIDVIALDNAELKKHTG